MPKFNEKFLIKEYGVQVEANYRGHYIDWKQDMWYIFMREGSPQTYVRKADMFTSSNPKEVRLAKPEKNQ